MPVSVIRAAYKGLLRAAGKLDRLGVPVAAELPALATVMPATATAAAASAQSFKAVIRSAFVGATPNVDGAIKALALANQRVAAVTAARTAKAAEVRKPSNVHFSVGQVIRHGLHGYRGVIVGWDATCKASGQWVAATGAAKLPSGTEQPYYRVLVDVRDSPGARVSYVAQDNVQLVDSATAAATADALERMVIHPLVTRHFDGFDLVKGHYVLSATTRRAYPADHPELVRRLRYGSPLPNAASASDSDSDNEADAPMTPGNRKRAGKAATMA